MAESKYAKNQLRMKCPVCKSTNYVTRKNKKLIEKKLEYSKFCSQCRKHTLHKEVKK